MKKDFVGEKVKLYSTRHTLTLLVLIPFQPHSTRLYQYANSYSLNRGRAEPIEKETILQRASR